MAKIGIRELKARAPQVVREVRERGEAVEITYRGEAVARLSPVEHRTSAEGIARAWKTFDRVAQDIGILARKCPTRRRSNWRRDL